MGRHLFVCGCNTNGVHSLSHQTSETVAMNKSAADIYTATVPCTAGVGDPVACGITGWSPGHCDTSEAFLDCCYITGR